MRATAQVLHSTDSFHPYFLSLTPTRLGTLHPNPSNPFPPRATGANSNFRETSGCTAVCRIECSPVLRDFEHATAVGQSDAPLKGHERPGRSCMGPWRRPAAHVPEIWRHETAFYSANGCIYFSERRVRAVEPRKRSGGYA